MKFPRRQFLHLAAGAAALPAVSTIARAQAWPSRPVRIIIGLPAGAVGDILARVVGRWLSERFGQSFIVDNRAGAGTNIGTEAVVRSPPDGYTLLWVTVSNAINATLYDRLNFDFLRDITPIASIIRTPLVMVVHPSLPTKSISEFIAYAKANPNKINMASAGNGTGSHMAGELFKMMAGVNMVHVHYRGAPGVNDLVGGQVQVMFAGTTNAIEHVRAGRLRALGVTTASRLDVLPDIPSVSDFVPGYEASLVDGIGAPKNTPAEIMDRLNKEINAGLSDPKIKARFADFGGIALSGSSADFRQLISGEVEKWAKVIRAANIKAE